MLFFEFLRLLGAVNVCIGSICWSLFKFVPRHFGFVVVLKQPPLVVLSPSRLLSSFFFLLPPPPSFSHLVEVWLQFANPTCRFNAENHR